MRTALALTPLALATTALLAGCGDQTPAVDSSSEPPMPSYSVSTSLPATPSTGTAPTRTPSASDHPTRTTRPSTTPAAPSTTASSPSTSPAAPGGTVHTYKNLTVRLPVADDAVPDAPTGLTAYLRQALEADWKRLGGTPGCERGGMITVSATRSDGFAYVMRDIDPALPDCPKAASMAGGYRAVWKSVDGTWQQVLGMQDVPPCSNFEKWSVPSALLGNDARCLQGGHVVRYQHS